jgi:CRISPR/Cas system-associated endonuclease Cas1
MGADFETYAMRGLVAVLGAALAAFIWREVTAKDKLWKAVNQNRLDHEAALKDARDSFTRALERVTGQFRLSIDSLNTAIGSLSTTVAKLDSTMAREYATKDDLRDTRNELRTEIQYHVENCPLKFGGGR